MDIWNEAKRSKVMSRIRGKNTKPEQIVRRLLTDMGYRYRLNVKSLPGKPDVVLRQYNVIVFVHGCFWHLCPHCKEGRIPGTRKEYWEPKLLANRRRDQRNVCVLRREGWKVLRVWECEVERRPQNVAKKLKALLAGETKP